MTQGDNNQAWSTALRPMTLGEILDRTFSIYRSGFVFFAGLSGPPALTLMVLQLLNEFWWRIPVPDMARLFVFVNLGLLIYMLIYFHLSSLFQYLLWPSIANLASGEVLGQPSTFRASLRSSSRCSGAHLGLALMQILFVLVIPEVACISLVAAVAATQEGFLHIDTHATGWFSILWLFSILLGLSAYFWVSSRVFLSWPAMMREGTSIRKSLRRGRLLSRGSRRRILVVQLLTVILWWVLNDGAILVLRFTLLGMGSGIPWHLKLRIYIVAIHLLRSSIDVLVWPIVPICITLIYYDQRIRQEGFDIEMMMDAAGMNATASAAPVDVAIPESESGELPA